MCKAYFCVERSFPGGDAGANRVLFMAKALQTVGWDVFVISTGHAKEEHFSEEKGIYVYQGVPYQTVPEIGLKKLGRVVRRLRADKETIDILKRQGLEKEDVVIIYSSSYSYTKNIMTYVNARGIRVVVDVVEWHQSFQFQFGVVDYRYILYKKCFENVYPKSYGVIAISKCLEEHFREIGCKTIVYPIFVDSRTPLQYKKKEDNILHLIYPGNPYRKDSLVTMLKALNLLSEKEKQRVIFHLTGVSIKHLYSCIPGDEKILDVLVQNGTVEIHSWMEYSELLQLYHIVDFALIARPENLVTKANFPSKVPELMNKGIVPIINPVGDIADYLSDGNDALFFPVCSEESCRDAIRRCLDLDPEDIYHMREQAKRTAQQRFDYRTSGAALSDFLRG